MKSEPRSRPEKGLSSVYGSAVFAALMAPLIVISMLARITLSTGKS
jgi:uncharacterized membrane protein